MQQPSNTACANHPERPAMAMCMACRKRICQTCSTEWDGIHFCVDCLAEQRREASQGHSVVPWLSLLAALFALYWMVHGGRLLMAQVWGGIFS